MAGCCGFQGACPVPMEGTECSGSAPAVNPRRTNEALPPETLGQARTPLARKLEACVGLPLTSIPERRVGSGAGVACLS